MYVHAGIPGSIRLAELTKAIVIRYKTIGKGVYIENRLIGKQLVSVLNKGQG
jgi:hypothetical protein